MSHSKPSTHLSADTFPESMPHAKSLSTCESLRGPHAGDYLGFPIRWVWSIAELRPYRSLSTNSESVATMSETLRKGLGTHIVLERDVHVIGDKLPKLRKLPDANPEGRLRTLEVRDPILRGVA